jgi:hypothetical protein
MRGGEMREGEMMAGGVAHEESGPTPLPALRSARAERGTGGWSCSAHAQHVGSAASSAPARRAWKKNEEEEEGGACGARVERGRSRHIMRRVSRAERANDDDDDR